VTSTALALALCALAGCGEPDPPGEPADMPEDSSEEMSALVDMASSEDMLEPDMSERPLPFDLGGTGDEDGCAPGELPSISVAEVSTTQLQLGAEASVDVTLATRCFSPPITDASALSRAPARVVARAASTSDPAGITVTLEAASLTGLDPGTQEFDVSVSSDEETLTLPRAFTLDLLAEN